MNDAFSTAHRAHASTEGLATSPAGGGGPPDAGANSKRSTRRCGNPKRPVCAIVGGAKVSTKLELLGNLVGKVDKLIIGGGMANTFMHAQGIKVGKSLCEKDLGVTALEISGEGEGRQAARSLLPVDIMVARRVQGQRAATRSSTPTPAPTTR